MADSAIPVTAGIGTNVDTRTEATNGNHRQVIVIGDPATNAGVAPVDVTNGLAVQIIPALPAGTNAIGKLASNTGVDIGDVDVTSIVPGGGATNLGKAIDAVAGPTDTGVAMLAIRDDSLSTLTPVAGDWNGLRVNSTGALWVQDSSLSAPGQAVAASSASVVLASNYGVPLESNSIFAGTTALTPKWAIVSESSSGNNEVVALVSAKKIRVLAWIVTASAAVNFKWRTASTDISGLFYAAAAGGGAGQSFNPLGHFETVAGEALNLNLSGAVAVGGQVCYVEV
jgi:hypothetical protein